MRYQLLSHYQDEGPTKITGREYDRLPIAESVAATLSSSPIIYGTVHVLDTEEDRIIQTYVNGSVSK